MNQVLKIIGGFLVGILIGLVAAGAGLILFGDMSFSEYIGKFSQLNVIEVIGIPLLSLAFFLIAIFLQVSLHEAGHLMCGLASGYRFVSFRIFSFTWIRQGGKVRMKRFSVSGTGGQCLLAPPEKPDEEIPVTLYRWGSDEFPDGISGFGSACAYRRYAVFMENVSHPVYRNRGFLGLAQRHPDENGRHRERCVFAPSLEAEFRHQACPCPPASDKRVDTRRNASEGDARSLVSFGGENRLWRYAASGILKQEAEAELLFTALVVGKEERARELAIDKLVAYIRTYSKVSSAKQRQLFAIALYMEHDKEKAEGIYRTVKAKREAR